MARQIQVLCVVAVLAMLTGASARVLAKSSAKSSAYAGKWHIVYSLRCVNSPVNEKTCTTILGSNLNVFGVRGTVFAYKDTRDVTVDARGRVSYHGGEVIVEKVSFLKPECDDLIETVGHSFNGTCTTTHFGTGHIARGVLRIPEFFDDCYTAIFHGPKPSTEKRCVTGNASDTGDTLYPARPGHWNSRQYLALFGIKRVPAGVTADLTVTRH